MNRQVRAALVALGSLAILWPGQVATQESCPATELVTRFGSWFTPDLTLTAGMPPQPIAPTNGNGVVAMRLLFEAVREDGADWKVVLRDGQHRVLTIVEAENFAPPPGQPAGTRARIWTGRLEASKIYADLVGAGPTTSITIREAMALPKPGEGENVFSTRSTTPDWQSIARVQSDVFLARGESVGMLATGGKLVAANGQTETGSWCCSGAMLTPDIYITNWHCGGTSTIDKAAYWTTNGACANTSIDLGWEEGTPARRLYSCSRVLHANQRLDYTLLRVKPALGPGAAVGRANPVRISETLPDDDGMFIVHHASCQTKLVSSSACRINERSRRGWIDPADATDRPEIGYDCDTEAGSSGAPVFDMRGRMIALHHLGRQREAVGASCSAQPVGNNKGVTMKAIMDDLRANKATIAGEIARYR